MFVRFGAGTATEVKKNNPNIVVYQQPAHLNVKLTWNYSSNLPIEIYTLTCALIIVKHCNIILFT